MVAAFFRLALLVVAMGMAGCGGYDVGPDPEPWTRSSAAPPAGSR